MPTALGRIPTDRRGEAEKLSISLSVSPAARRGDVPGVLLPMQTAASPCCAMLAVSSSVHYHRAGGYGTLSLKIYSVKLY